MSAVPYIPAGDPRSRLTPERRRRDRDALAAGGTVDVLVVGGGITGVGVALDAASRGLSVALVERHDLAWGTSRWSSKLVHGGLRYLAQGDVAIAWESAVERDTLMRRVAPHLVGPLLQLVPMLDTTSAADEALVAAGLRAADVLRRAAGTPSSLLPRPRRVDRVEALALAPALDASRLRGGWLVADGKLEDDARLVVAVARTAAAYGASILTRSACISVGAGGAVVHDGLDGGTYEVRARRVVNATGVWAGELDPTVQVAPSRGTHLVVRSATLGHPAACLTAPVPGHRSRFVFAIPHDEGLVHIGLTDVEAPGPVPEVPEPTTAEIDWLRETFSRVLARPLLPDDVVGAYAGLRPLLAPLPGDAADGSPADLSRRHEVRGHPDGLLTVTGGKLTTYRRMAEDAVDLVTPRPGRTHELPLVGAGPPGARPGAGDPRTARWVRRYGTEAAHLAALAETDPLLAEPLADGVHVTGAEVAWAVQAEAALDVDDVLERRTRVALVPADAEAARGRALEVLARYGTGALA